MKRKMYRIELRQNGGIANEIATLAALSNGGKYISLKDLEAVAKTEVIRYPTLNNNISINLIGENDFTIDKGTENLLFIQEVEILELDIPTLSRQQANGLLDPDKQELLN